MKQTRVIAMDEDQWLLVEAALHDVADYRRATTEPDSSGRVQADRIFGALIAIQEAASPRSPWENVSDAELAALYDAACDMRDWSACEMIYEEQMLRLMERDTQIKDAPTTS